MGLCKACLCTCLYTCLHICPCMCLYVYPHKCLCEHMSMYTSLHVSSRCNMPNGRICARVHSRVYADVLCMCLCRCPYMRHGMHMSTHRPSFAIGAPTEARLEIATAGRRLRTCLHTCLHTCLYTRQQVAGVGAHAHIRAHVRGCTLRAYKCPEHAFRSMLTCMLTYML